MKLTWQSFRFLSKLQKLRLATYLTLKVGTAAFDILGLVLLSTSMSLVASSPVQQSPIVKLILNWCSDFGFGNTYAVFALFATAFFLSKSIIAIWLNSRIANFGAEVESQQAGRLFHSLANTDVDGEATETVTSFQFAVGRSAHVLFAQVPVVLGTIVGEVALAIAVTVYLATINVFLLCLALMFLAVVAYVNFSLVSRGVVRNNRKAITAGLVSQQLVLDLIANSRQIRAQNKAKNFSRKFQSFRSNQAQATAKVVAIGYMSRYITEIAVIVGVALFLAQRTFFESSELSASTLTVFLAAAFRVVASMIPIQTAFATLSVIDHEGALALSLLNTDSRPVSESSIRGHARPSIRVRGASYAYPTGPKPVVQELNLSIPFGSFVVVKGASGAGKSTLVDMLVGLKSPTTGSVVVAEETTEVQLDWEDIRLGYVPQKPNLIEGSLLQNVALEYVESPDSRGRATKALELAQLGSWLAGLPAGLDSEFGVSAANLSGGQLQRLGLARALYDEPDILVLDEGTNSLDASTELKIRTILESLRSGITIIVISHNDVFDSLATMTLVVQKDAKVIIEGKL